ncbi:MAG TPA: hypothetical protein VIE65_13770 [Methylobacter sp.]|jgi:chromosome segregation ATPase
MLIKDFFVNTFTKEVAEESEEAKIKVPPSDPPSTEPAVPVPNIAAKSINSERAAAIDKAAKTELEPALSSSKYQKEITDTMNDLVSEIPNEEARFKAAVKMVVRRGPTLVDLVSDVDSCLGVLQQKGREFRETLEEQIKTKVGSKQARISEIDSIVASKQAEIDAAQKEITKLHEEKHTCGLAVLEEQHDIDEVKSRFETVYRSVESDLTAKKARLQSLTGK